jgi:ligand-binding sensor domain-containing protein/signal transduction histidine kinase
MRETIGGMMAGPGTIGLRLVRQAAPLVVITGLALAAGPPGVPLQFKHLTAEDGLSHSWVRAILQDRQGYMWLGTNAGLNRYDGYKFRIYRHERGKPHSLLNASINCLFQDTKGRLWIGHEAGFSLYRPATDDFENFTTSTSAEPGVTILPALGTNIRCIVQDVFGDLWLASNAGLMLFHPDTKRLDAYRHDPKNPSSLGNNDVRFIIRDDKGTLWLTVANGLNRFDRVTHRFRQYAVSPGRSINPTQLAIDRFDYLWVGTDDGLCRLDLNQAEEPALQCFRHDRADPESLASDYSRVVFTDRDGQVWIGTENGGLDRFDYETSTFVHCQTDPNNPSSLNNDSVYSLFEDRTGILWVGTFAGGVNLTRKNQDAILHFATLPGSANSPSYNSITDFFEDKEGYVWICTDGGGLDRFDPKTRQFRHWSSRNSGLTRDAVLDVFEDDGELLIGTWAGGLNVFNPRTGTVRAFTTHNSNLPSNSIFEIAKDRRGRLLLATYLSGLIVRDPVHNTWKSYVPDQNPFRDANALLLQEAADGDFFVGTETGLMIFHPDDDSLQTFHHDDFDPSTISGERVYAVAEMGGGIYYIGTDEGLDRFDKRTGTFTHVDAPLPGSEVRSMAKDRQGEIWIGTNRGLCRYSPGTGQVKYYTKADGTLGDDYNRCAYLITRDGTIYLGGVNNGFNIIYPNRITENRIPPNVVITDFKIANRSVTPGHDSPLRQPVEVARHIDLPYFQSSFTFELAALDFSNPGRNLYAYKLDGFDKEWNQVGSQHSATYTNISPGSYVFRARAANADGYWNNQGISIGLEIHPPVWGTVWFRLLAIGSLCAVVLSIVLSARRRRRILESMNTQLNAEILHARKAEEGLREARDQLEQKVRERTVELTERANQLRTLAGELTLAEQRERRHLAKLLHDHLQQLLVGAKFRVVALGKCADPVVKQAAEEIQTLLTESIEASRSLTAELSPPILHEGGLAAGLEWLAHWMNEKHGLRVRLNAEEDLTAAAEDVSVLLFESVRELLFNVVKHAKVRSASVHLERLEGQMLRISVRDQGVGFNPHSLKFTREGFGLFSIRERLSLVGGHLEMKSRPGHGAELTLIAPLRRESMAGETSARQKYAPS